MKGILLILAGFLISVASVAQVNFKTGDADLDVSLKDFNVTAKANLPLFKKEITVTYNIPEGKLDIMMSKNNMEPADVVMAAEVAQQSHKPIDEVINSYVAHKDQGWGVIAKEMGIKPGSPEFHALKNNVKGKSNKMKQKNKEKGKSKGAKGKGKGAKK